MSSIKDKIKNGKYTAKAYSFVRELVFGGKTRKDKKIKREMLQKNGKEIISRVQEIMEETNLKFFFDMGTLLGIIREGRLLGHDIDIDIAVYLENDEQLDMLHKVLESNGCKRRFSYSSSNIGIFEDSFIFKDVKFDICYYRTIGDKDLCYLGFVNPEKDYVIGTLDTVVLTCSAIKATKKIPFGDTLINVPENPESYLAERYGDDWTIPNKGYVYWKGPSAKRIEDICKKEYF